MQYKLIGQTVPMVETILNKGEVIYTQSGGMIYQSDGLEMTTNARGGVMQSIGRIFSGESLFMVNYEAKVDGAKVAFASTVPGEVRALNLNELPDGIILQKRAFLCAENTVNTQVEFTKKFTAGLFGGEGFILQKATGTGMLFIEIDGDAVEMNLQPGEILKVDTGNVVGFEPTVKYEIEMVKGFKNIFLGGEGLFLTKLQGPGKIILQSQNFGEFANKLIPYMPTQRYNN